MTAPTSSDRAADPTLCPKCGSKRTVVREHGFQSKRVCFDCWHEWLLGYVLWPDRSTD